MAVHENCGSNTCELGSRSLSVRVVVFGHDQLKLNTDDGVPWLPSASTGVTCHQYWPSVRRDGME